ncbi:McrC family protein [Mycoplasmopsis cynos]|uniref:5-methylcytosine-specific restriction enzyme subunit McrC n=3 Tax=Mycoplasmopsis cynos TaxID=171284 RepID=A0A449AIM7_9BACT|nr:hypothetical protein [Mycoplasmopsis cynos]VEU64864.1 5-methylcytosine-specific restriction enzyme subunit McrC [Mycoplasmopsis cynos]
MKNKLISVIEYEKISAKSLESKFGEEGNFYFQEIKNNLFKMGSFTENNEKENKINLFWEFGYNRFGIEYLKFKNYIGTIMFKNGIQIEIIPKIYNKNEDEYLNISKAKDVFKKMLESLMNFKHMSFNTSSQDSSKMDIYDIFVLIYLNNIRELIKKGIKNTYHEVESNQNYIKGKLLIKEQINKNLINKNKFYIKYDSYNSNKPENKIIKSVLLKLKKETKNINIQKTINNLLSYFLDVESSKNFENDYRKIIFNKNNFYYKDIIEWSIIFLRNNSFINFSGNHNVKALLFNMHFLFESYISKIIEKTGHKKNYKTKLQDKSHWLFAYKKVPLRPDIVVNKSEKTYVIDVKWKTIEKESDISQSDFYQIFAYNAQYKSEKSYLIYPKYKNINSFRFFSSGDNNKLVLEIIFFDLTNDPFKEIENLFL